MEQSCDYIAMALTGGYPEVTALQTDRNRRLWLGSYVDQLVTRDASLIGSHRDPRRLRGYLQALAANSAGRAEHKTLYDAAGITRNTALTYDELLELMMINEQVPAWSTNQLSRLGRSPKRYLTDPSLLAALLQLDGRGALRDGDLLGRQIDTFVLAQLRAELTVSNMSATLSHLRLDDGRRIMELESRLIAPGLNQVARFIRRENVESPTPKHLRLSRPP